jgi:hypothetical protein
MAEARGFSAQFGKYTLMEPIIVPRKINPWCLSSHRLTFKLIMENLIIALFR